MYQSQDHPAGSKPSIAGESQAIRDYSDLRKIYIKCKKYSCRHGELKWGKYRVFVKQERFKYSLFLTPLSICHLTQGMPRDALLPVCSMSGCGQAPREGEGVPRKGCGLAQIHCWVSGVISFFFLRLYIFRVEILDTVRAN